MSKPNGKTVLLLMTLLCIGGCEQFYTGSMGLNFSDRDQVEAYQQFKAEQAEQLATAKLAERRTGPVDFQAPDTKATANGDADRPVIPAATFSRNPAAFGATAQVGRDVNDAAGLAKHRVGTLGLFGHINSPASDQRSSPLDSPGDLRQMTFTVEGADFDPDPDPTGTQIVYASTRHRDTADLYVKRVTGNAITQLTSDPANEVMPAFSPDGKWIAFASDRSGTWNIYIMPVRGGKAQQLTDTPTHDLHPSFSPDGTRLVYSSYGGPSAQWEMIIIDVQNPSTKRVLGLGLFPTWSPTQETILFQRARQRGTRWFSVWTIDLIDGEPTPPTEIAVSANAAVITPDWSPDGKQVVFCTVIDPRAEEEQRPGQADIWITASDGTGRVRMTAGRFANLQPAWSVDGSILFVSDRSAGGIENIWAVHPGRALDLAQPATTPESAPASVMVPTQ